MNKYRITVLERHVLEVEADSVEEAETKAFESDAWNVIVEEYETELVSTDDSILIFKTFEKDSLS